MRPATILTTLTAVSVLVAASLGRADQPSFMGLGDLPGGSFMSHAWDVSPDGSVVVGESYSASGLEAFRWARWGGMVGLGDLPGGNFMSRAWAVSEHGTVIVGGSHSGQGHEAFRWTFSEGMIGLGDWPGGLFSSDANSVTPDGSVIVGSGTPGTGPRAFRWEDGVMVNLGELPGGSESSVAFDVSADGSVIVGHSSSSLGLEAFRWVESCPFLVTLGDLPGGDFDSRAYGVSADGWVVVGVSSAASGNEAFRWEDGIMTSLGPGGDSRISVSADGSVVGSGLGTAFIWDVVNGRRNLHDVLVSLGLDLTGWTLTSVQGISASGTTIVGLGINPDGFPEGWIAVIDCYGGSADFDGDGFPDACDRDVDNDGVPNDVDVCGFTSPGLAVDSEGRPKGDMDNDCDVDGVDVQLFVDQLLLSQ